MPQGIPGRAIPALGVFPQLVILDLESWAKNFFNLGFAYPGGIGWGRAGSKGIEKEKRTGMAQAEYFRGVLAASDGVKAVKTAHIK